MAHRTINHQFCQPKLFRNYLRSMTIRSLQVDRQKAGRLNCGRPLQGDARPNRPCRTESLRSLQTFSHRIDVATIRMLAATAINAVVRLAEWATKPISTGPASTPA